MDKCKERMIKLTKDFKECQKAFVALGDETRQLIIIALLESDYSGIRVGEITKKTHLSRPAVSHHLQILKEAGIINMRREGTKNYYYVNSSETQWRQLTELMNYIYGIVKEVSCNKKEDELF